jgi:hypothetical protein
VASADAAAGGSLGGATLVTAGAAGGARLLATRTEAQVAAETRGALLRSSTRHSSLVAPAEVGKKSKTSLARRTRSCEVRVKVGYSSLIAKGV